MCGAVVRARVRCVFTCRMNANACWVLWIGIESGCGEASRPKGAGPGEGRITGGREGRGLKRRGCGEGSSTWSRPRRAA